MSYREADHVVSTEPGNTSFTEGHASVPSPLPSRSSVPSAVASELILSSIFDRANAYVVSP